MNKVYKLSELTKEKVNEIMGDCGHMDIITNSCTKYHIYKVKDKYYCESWNCNNRRSLTKAMKKVFC